jgi:hypothetical protein
MVLNWWELLLNSHSEKSEQELIVRFFQGRLDCSCALSFLTHKGERKHDLGLLLFLPFVARQITSLSAPFPIADFFHVRLSHPIELLTLVSPTVPFP